MVPNSLTIIVPALNEEKNVGAVCVDMARVAEQILPDYEILVVDDASQDKTADVVRAIQQSNPKVRLVQNETTQGLGKAYRIGLLEARCQYAMLIPGDNQILASSMAPIFSEVGKTDIVVCYIKNQEVRPPWRHAISLLFTGILNFLFRLNLRYYNGTTVLETEIARQVVPPTSGYAYMAVMLVNLLKAGLSYKQVGFTLQERTYGRTKAFHLKNIISVAKTVLLLYWRVMICGQRKTLSRTAQEPKYEKAIV
jgi:dolichol-phosphate mannosyltransferase